jgi:hypothetical protein
MSLLPNHQAADIDIAKLRDYCLNPAHPRGRHKARLFQSALGIGAADAGWLRLALIAGISKTDSDRQDTDQYGERWRADILVTRQTRHVVVRTIWMIRAKEAVPRLVTCWVL